MEVLTKEERMAIVQHAYENPVYFCKFFLPRIFPGEIPWVHWGILAILTRRVAFLKDCPNLEKLLTEFTYQVDPGNEHSEELPIFTQDSDGEIHMAVNRYTEIMLPRGFSKTMLGGVAVPLYSILYSSVRFVVYLSETATHAETQLQNVQRELESNELILEFFGNLKPERQDSERWTASYFETTTGVKAAARGRGGQVRGLNVGGNRPDLIILDDVEDIDSVRTEEQRKKVRNWLYSDVIPALAELNPNAAIVALGTLLHSESLLMTLRNDPDWTCIRFGALDSKEQPLWPEMMGLEKLHNKKLSFTRAGELNAFYMEYHNQIRNEANAKFKQSFIIYQPASSNLMKAIAMDPAISEERRADFAAIGVVGIEETGIITVCECWMAKGQTPRQLIDKFFELYLLWMPDKAGIESIAYQKALIHLMREEMFRPDKQGKARPHFEVQPITHSNQRSKQVRVEGILQPRYANGYMRHARPFPQLETQLLDWPNGKLDGPDVIAMAVSLLDPYAAMAGVIGLGQLDDNSYEELDADFGRWAN